MTELKEVVQEPTIDEWHSYCCGRDKSISRPMLKYIIQCVFSLLVLLFSFYMCVTATDSTNREVWISTISCIVGLHVPAPHPEEK